MMKRTLVIMVCAVGFTTGCDEDAYACDEMSSQLVARTYVLTMPLVGRDNEMIPLMQSYPGYFAEGGGAILCMQVLGSALVQGGLNQSAQSGGYSATERFGADMPAGLAHLPGQVDASMQSYGSDMYAMGQELLWLAQVLPAAAQGNYTPYNTPGTQARQMASQVLPIYQMLCETDPSACQMLLGVLNEMAPQIEQQVYDFARQLGS